MINLNIKGDIVRIMKENRMVTMAITMEVIKIKNIKKIEIKIIVIKGIRVNKTHNIIITQRVMNTMKKMSNKVMRKFKKIKNLRKYFLKMFLVV